MLSNLKLPSELRREAPIFMEDPSAASNRDMALHALAHPIRRLLIGELLRGDRTLQELVATFPQEARALHYHLRALREGGLIVCHRLYPRRGTYSIRVDVPFDLASLLPMTGETNAPVESTRENFA